MSSAVPSVIGGRFRLERETAAGGMGTVYRAKDLKTQKKVALKILRPATEADVARFRREAAFLASVKHPRIVRYVGHGITDDKLEYLAMEWVDGKTLATFLTEVGINIRETLLVGAGIAEGLHALHEAGVVHRDIKPRNIMMSMLDLRQIKILDLGVARAEEDSTLTKTGFMVGSYGYIAPEHARGRRDLDGRSDLFSLGCVLYECLTGEAPFAGREMLAVRTKLLLWEPPSVRAINTDVSSALDELVTQLLRKDPRQRPSTAREVADRLRGLEEAEGVRKKRSTERVPLTTAEITRTAAMPVGGSGGIFMLFVGTDRSVTAGADLQEILQVFEGVCRFELMADGWLVVTFRAELPAEALAAMGVQAAAALREVFQEEPMVLIGLDFNADGLRVDGMIERGVALSAKETRGLFFRGLSNHPGNGALRLDDAAAAALKMRYPLVERDTGTYLTREILRKADPI